MSCAECVFCSKLYVPPAKCFNDIPKDSYVCTLFLKETNSVQYLGDDSGRCEMFERSEEK